MSNTVDIAFVFLPSNEMERLAPGEIACEISAYDHHANCRLVTIQPMHAGERMSARLVFAQEAPVWLRKGLTIRLRKTILNEGFGAAIVQIVMARGTGDPNQW